MAEPIQTSPAATDSPDQLSRAATFEMHALARLAEEVETQVDPAVFSAAFDLFRAANRLMYDFEAHVHRPLGMSWAGFRVLFCTWIENEVEPRELARLCAVSRGTVSSVLNTLERDALVSRRKQSVDRRVVTVMITGAPMAGGLRSGGHRRSRGTAATPTRIAETGSPGCIVRPEDPVVACAAPSRPKRSQR